MKTSALNRAKYAELLAKTLPRAIRNDEELQHFAGILLEMEEIEEPTPEQDELAELLISLVIAYEEARYPVRKSSPVEMLQFLMEQRGLLTKDLAPVVGSKGTSSDIVNGKRPIGVAVASKLGEFFRVAPELFISWKDLPVTPAYKIAVESPRKRAFRQARKANTARKAG